MWRGVHVLSCRSVENKRDRVYFLKILCTTTSEVVYILEKSDKQVRFVEKPEVILLLKIVHLVQSQEKQEIYVAVIIKLQIMSLRISDVPIEV